MTPRKVACLYRVSTKGQLDKDNQEDIPIQKKACAEFIAKQGWILVKEYIEGGVSGYKTSAAQRDAIIQAKQDALNKEFDILLVFMFDRLGRREEETPFVVKWFTKNGVDVWSVREGERRFDSHVDNLINYITFWQSSGESKKTSIRVKESMKQMIEEGKFKGGIAPFGYELVRSGVYNKKGKELMKLVINPETAHTVKIMFELYVNHGYGCLRIANYLNERGSRTRLGKLWLRTSVAKLLQNPIYIGYLRSDHEIQEVYTEEDKIEYKLVKRENPVYSSIKNEDLMIVDDDLFNKAQMIFKVRLEKKENDETPTVINIPTKGHLLLSGLVYCGNCGAIMTVKHHHVYLNKGINGEIRKRIKYKYVCNNRREKGKNVCKGQYSYSKEKIENIVLEYLEKFIDKVKQEDINTDILTKQKEEISRTARLLKSKETELSKVELLLKKLEQEISKVLLGESQFDSKSLTNLIKQNEAIKAELEKNIKTITQNLQEQKLAAEDTLNSKKAVVRWDKEFKKASEDEQKVLLSKILNKVIVTEDKIEMEINPFLHRFMVAK